MIRCFAHADGGSAWLMVGEAHACCLSCCDKLFCVRCMSGTTCHVAFVVIFCADFVGCGVAWSEMIFACSVVRLFIPLFYVCTVRAVFCCCNVVVLYWCAKLF